MEQGKSWKIISYDVERYVFRSWVSDTLGVSDLEHIHQSEAFQQFTNHIERIEHFRNKLRGNFAKITPIFQQFVKQELAPLWGEIQLYQNPPTFRIHFDGDPTISAFHRDRDYGTPRDWLNVWLPMTHVWGNNTIWVESQEGLEDFVPIELKCGEVLVFDGANLLHGSMKNDTGSTRVSMDFRFSPDKGLALN